MLIKDIETLKKIIPTIVGKDFSLYETWLDSSDRWLYREITGYPLYLKLEDQNNEYILSVSNRITAFRAYLDAIPFLDLVQTETGFGVVSQAGNIAPASKERVQALIKQTEKSLSDACEDLIRYLEETPAYHSDWKQSQAYSFISDSLIHTLDEFNRYANFYGTRLDFVKVRPIMLKIQKMKIEPVISTELSSEIITQLRSSGGLSAANKTIIDYLRFALAFMTVDDKQYKSLIITNPYERKADESIESDKNGESFLLQARKTIMANIESFPAFKNSSLYTEILANNANTNSADDPFLIAGA
jgi:hypothetical protein